MKMEINIKKNFTDFIDHYIGNSECKICEEHLVNINKEIGGNETFSITFNPDFNAGGYCTHYHIILNENKYKKK